MKSMDETITIKQIYTHSTLLGKFPGHSLLLIELNEPILLIADEKNVIKDIIYVFTHSSKSKLELKQSINRYREKLLNSGYKIEFNSSSFLKREILKWAWLEKHKESINGSIFRITDGEVFQWKPNNIDVIPLLDPHYDDIVISILARSITGLYSEIFNYDLYTICLDTNHDLIVNTLFCEWTLKNKDNIKYGTFFSDVLPPKWVCEKLVKMGFIDSLNQDLLNPRKWGNKLFSNILAKKFENVTKKNKDLQIGKELEEKLEIKNNELKLLLEENKDLKRSIELEREEREKSNHALQKKYQENEELKSLLQEREFDIELLINNIVLLREMGFKSLHLYEIITYTLYEINDNACSELLEFIRKTMKNTEFKKKWV